VGKGKLTHAQPTVSWSVGAIAGRYIQSLDSIPTSRYRETD